MKHDKNSHTYLPRALPIFRGYTIDERLREFRKASTSPPSIEFIAFDSEKGQELLRTYRYQKDDALNTFL